VTRTRRLLITVFGLALSASTAGAYYHFYHYSNRSAPYNPVPEKFDLNTLPNKTVTFFLSDTSAGCRRDRRCWNFQMAWTRPPS
jgi:hypothetical protein